MKRFIVPVAVLGFVSASAIQCLQPAGAFSQWNPSRQLSVERRNSAAPLTLYVESGIHHSARAVAFSADGLFLATGSLDRTIKIWDVRSSRELLALPNARMSTSLVFHHVRPIVVSSNEDGTVTVWDYTRQELIATLKCGFSSPSIALSRDDDTLMCADAKERAIKRWNTSRFEPKEAIAVPKALSLASLQFTADGTLAIHSDGNGNSQLRDVTTFEIVGTLAGYSGAKSVVYADQLQRLIVADQGSGLRVWQWSRGTLRAIEQPTIQESSIHSVALSADQRFLAYAKEDGDVIVLNSQTLRETSRLKSRSNRVERAGFESDPTRLYVQVWYDSRFMFDLRKGVGVYGDGASSGESPSSWSDSVRFNDLELEVRNNGTYLQLVSAYMDGTSAAIATIVLLDKERGWVAVAPDGRFDTNMDLTDVRGAHWVESGRAFVPLSLDLFMRDHYEPKLLPRLLTCTSEKSVDTEACRKQFRDIPALATLNRVQPRVRIVGVRPGASRDEVLVDVEAEGATDASQPNGRTTTGAYDLRLFREGQLVGQWPAAAAAASTTDLAQWRAAARVATPARTFAVRLPTAGGSRPISFTVYAFNEDRVKSETARAEYSPPADLPRRPARAYVVTIGVNEYQNPRRRLNFAVKDADGIAAALASIKGYEVVPVALLSDARPGRASVNDATKARIRGVLRTLAGHPERSVAGIAGVDRLRKATPDDLVILSFSGHGHTERNGAFYLLPADSGTDDAITPETLQAFISSDELSEWVRDIDAGQMAMIIDACHAAASVDAGGFKPGPMGDRGLGQLAYDKGMRILAASQADDIALEVAGLQHGLLTYALVEDGLTPTTGGLRPADLSRDGAVTLEEWLQYAEQRVPGLYDDVRSGKLRLVARDSTVNPVFLTETIRRAQTPALFNFHKSPNTVVIR